MVDKGFHSCAAGGIYFQEFTQLETVKVAFFCVGILTILVGLVLLMPAQGAVTEVRLPAPPPSGWGLSPPVDVIALQRLSQAEAGDQRTEMKGVRLEHKGARDAGCGSSPSSQDGSNYEGARELAQ